MSAPSSVTFNVGMICGGCEGAVRRVLGKVEGVGALQIDVAAKRVVVVGGTAPPAALLAALQKWGTAAGKSVELASPSA